MQSKIILYKLCLLFGIIILIVGINLRFSNYSAGGFTYGIRGGGSGNGEITPNGTLGIGLFLLIMGVIVKYIYKKEAAERILEKQKEAENIKLKSRKNKRNRSK